LLLDKIKKPKTLDYLSAFRETMDTWMEFNMLILVSINLLFLACEIE